MYRISTKQSSANAVLLFGFQVDLAVWPLAQVFNFYLIPSHLRVLYVSLVTFGWSTFLAYYRANWQRQGSSRVQTGNLLNPVIARVKEESVKYHETQVDIINMYNHVPTCVYERQQRSIGVCQCRY